MSVLFRHQHRRQWTAEPPVSPFPGAAFSGTGDQALRLDTVWACVRMLSETVAMMPVVAMNTRAGVETPMKPAPALVTMPAPNLSMSAWLRQMMMSLLLRGNAYALATWSGGAVSQLIPISPDDVAMRMQDGKPVWSLKGLVIPDEQLFRMTWMRMPGQQVGISPISYQSELIRAGEAMDQFSTGFFTDAPHPQALVTTDSPINQDQAKQIKDRVMSSTHGREPLVLGLGVTYKPLSISPEEAQFLETQKMNASRICRIFGVPPELVGAASSGSSITYANIQSRMTDFLTLSLQPWLHRFVEAISPILPGNGLNGQHIAFDTTALIRMAPDTEASVESIWTNAGIRTINEIRVGHGWEKVPWGDQPFVKPTAPPAPGQSDVTGAAKGNQQ